MTFIDKIYNRLWRLSPSVILVIVNVAVFVVLRLIAIIIRFAGEQAGVDSVVNSLLLPHSFGAWVSAPWTALTYMFVQYEPMHLLMNMLWLYMFGHILDKVVSRRQLFATYIFGGIIGALFYLVIGTVGSQSAGLTGASASILAVMASAVVMMPDLKLKLLFFGEATLKVVCLIAILLVFIATGIGNYSVHAAHAGGLFAGVVIAFAARHKAFRMPSRVSVVSEKKITAECDASLDQLLDKIRRSGFNSLTPAERVRLIKISSELQKHHNESKH